MTCPRCKIQMALERYVFNTSSAAAPNAWVYTCGVCGYKDTIYMEQAGKSMGITAKPPRQYIEWWRR